MGIPMAPAFLSIALLGDRYFQTRAVPGDRIDHEFTTDGPHSFLDDPRSLTDRLQFGLRVAPGEFEAAAIVLNNQLAVALISSQAYQDVSRQAVFPDVKEGLLCDARQL